MLRGNYNVFNLNTGRAIGGMTDPSRWVRPASLNNFYTGWHNKTDETNKANFSNGYNPPYSWILAPKSGGIASIRRSAGSGTVTLNLAAGKSLVATVNGIGSQTGTLELIINISGTASGVGSQTGNLGAPLQIVGTAAGTCTVTGVRSALAYLISIALGQASNNATLNAHANLSGDITPFTTLSPENLAASVWNAIASENNDSGTMGEKLNAAGTAGDPWTTDLSGYNTADTAGKIIKQIKSNADLIPATI